MTASGKPVSILWRLTVVGAALAGVFAASQAQANGTAPTVVAGQAKFSTLGGSLNITNSPGTIINWQGFSIGASETTRFIQQSAASSVLNRVIGSDPSVILGTLTSNGRVFLINPSGILFGQGARIDVAGLVASTLNLSNQNFLAGRLNFESNPLAGKVENQGNITTPSGGSVYLVGANVSNSGIINSPQGDVILAAGQSVNIFDSSTPGVRVEITASDNVAVNLGEILAQSGQVGIYGAAFRNTGIINADQVGRDASGTIVLRAKQDVTIEAGSHISVNGEQGGTIIVQSETGTTLASGVIEAKGTGNVAGQGGTVQLLGNHVGLITASVDVSGATGGGTVLVGGDLHGTNSAVQNASATYMSADSTITADAITNGSGGKVVLWANDSARAYGSITARGGVRSGDGGLAETSGHWLDVAGINVNASALNGRRGIWLLDPSDVTITGAVDSGGSYSGGTPDVFSPGSGANTSNVNVTTITTALNLGTDVTITTANSGTSGSGNGDISIDAVITWDRAAFLPPPSILTLSAVRDVNVNSAITATNGSFVANAGRDVNVKGVITTTDGNVVLRAGKDGSGSGTVAFFSGGSVSVTNGAASIYYNPSSYVAPTDYSSYFTLSTSTLTSYMWVFAQGSDKVYDGLTTASLSFVGSPTTGGAVTLVLGAANFDTGNAGAGKTVTYSGYGLGGANANKFALFSSAGTTTANITQRAITVTANASQTKTYGNADPSSFSYTNSGLGAGTALVGALDRAAGENVGTYAIGQGTLTNAANANYLLTYVGDNFGITQRAVTVTASSGQAKTYGNADPLSLTYTNSSLGAGITLVGALDRATGENVGTYAIGQGTLTNAANTNYLLTYAGDNFGIIQRAVTVTAGGGQAKTYGNADPLSFTYTNSSLGAGAVLVGALDRVAGENVGTYAIGQGTLTNAANTNYLLTYADDNFGITQRAIIVTAGGGQAKIYGNANPLSFTYSNTSLGTGAVLVGALDRVAGENVGNYALGQGTLTNASNTNYSLTYVGDNFAITQRAITVTAGNGQLKTYGNADPVSFSYANSSLGAGTALVGVLDRVAGENVGNYAIGQGTMTNAANTNYSLTYVGDNFGITQRAVTVTANGSQTKAYGNADPLSFTYANTSLGAGVALVGALDRVAGENVGNYAIGQGALTNASNTNYALTYVADNFGITQRAVTVTANASQTKTYGNADPLSFTYANTSLGTGMALVGALDRAAGENVGAYAIGQGTLTNAANANYLLTYAGDNFGITQRAVTVTANASQTKTYGNANPASFTYINSSLGTGAALVGALDRAAGENVGNYAIGRGALTNATNTNYLLTYVGDNFGITRAVLAVAANAKSKAFGTSDPALTFSVTGLVNNPALGIADTSATVFSGTLTRAPGETALGGPYAITQGSLAANSNYTLGFTHNYFSITGAAAPVLGRDTAAKPILDFNAGRTIFAGVINNEFYYRPGNFWHISLNADNADPGFDVMRGTQGAESTVSLRLKDCGGGSCETWTFPQQFEKVDIK